MKISRSGFWGSVIAGILLCLLMGCVGTPKTPVSEIPAVEKKPWEEILDEIPWDAEYRIVGSVEADVPTLPPELFSVMYKYGYQYVNSTHKKWQTGEADMVEYLYEVKREGASYDPDDDTFMFIGEFSPDETHIWLIFSKESDYELFAEPDETNKKAYSFNRVHGTEE
jgi:hypothetical protein